MKVVAWVMMGLGVLFLGIGLWMLSTAYMSTTWPTVEGEVVETKVAARIGQVGDALRRHLEYSVEVKYQFDVNGVNYQASRYSLGSGNTVVGGYSEKSEAREWLKNSPYQQGAAVTVYYDADDPSETVLSAGIKWSTYMPVVLGLMLLVMGYFVRKNLVQT